MVRSRPLTWDGKVIGLGPPRLETAQRVVDGRALVDDISPGDWVALHWDWVCDRLNARQLGRLRHYSRLQLDITNKRVTHPGPALILG